MKPMNRIMLFLSIGLLLSSCSYHAMDKQKVAEEIIIKPQMEPLVGTLSQQDQAFVDAVMKSVTTAEKIMGELEAALDEMEAHDEFHEANEMMDHARQDALFQWNKIHNEYRPEHPELIRLQEYYEDILFRYREGINLEMEGMESGDAPKMKHGYELTGQAIQDLRELAKQLAAAF